MESGPSIPPWLGGLNESRMHTVGGEDLCQHVGCRGHDRAAHPHRISAAVAGCIHRPCHSGLTRSTATTLHTCLAAPAVIKPSSLSSQSSVSHAAPSLVVVGAVVCCSLVARHRGCSHTLQLAKRPCGHWWPRHTHTHSYTHCEQAWMWTGVHPTGSLPPTSHPSPCPAPPPPMHLFLHTPTHTPPLLNSHAAAPWPSAPSTHLLTSPYEATSMAASSRDSSTTCSCTPASS